MLTKLLILALIGALIGYSTNVIAVKLLFRPLKPIFGIQGLIPKRRDEIADNIARVITEELVSNHELRELIESNFDFETMKEHISVKIKETIKAKASPLIAPFIEPFIDKIIDENGNEFYLSILDKALENLEDKLDLESHVSEKIKAFDLVELERIILDLAKKELRHIEVLGGVIGLLIGIIQGFIILNI